MMTLYYSPGACSLADHIALHEAGEKFNLVKVDLKTHKLEDGRAFKEINPKGYVPALELDNGQILTEVGTIIQYLADQKKELKLVPEAYTMERYRLMEWINFISTEIHKQFGPLFRPNTPEETRQNQTMLLAKRFDFLAERLKGKQYLMGENFTVADAYLFTVLNWSPKLKIDLAPWPIIQTYMTRVASRPCVTETLRAEELVK